jgi:hypothetical protein
MKNQKHAVRYANRTIVVINPKHGARKGTKRAKAMEVLCRTKNTSAALPLLKRLGADSSFIRFAVEQRFIKLSRGTVASAVR